jgi:hypothetical protein
MLAALTGACGGGGSLPDQGECPEIDAFVSTVLQDRAYRITVARELGVIGQIDDGFRVAWDERRIRELPEFRADFAEYAHLTRCHATFLLEARAPMGTSTGLEAAVRDYATRLIAAIDEGTEAVETRNNSRYRDWVRVIDALAAETDSLRQDTLRGTGEPSS